MAIKFIVLFTTCIVAVSAGIAPFAAPYAFAPAHLDEHDPHPQYTYGYDVKDVISGDSKTQLESRDGDVVQGQYSLNDADGFRRIVDYTSDPVNGFNAIVRREPLVAAVAAPVVAAAPAPVARFAAPAPVAAVPAAVKTSFASPLISYAY